MTPFAGWLLAGVAALAGFVGLGLWNPGSDSVPPFCLVRLLLDLPCPGCGMTRALHALARGDLAAALRFHPLAPVLALEGAAAWIVWGIRSRRGFGRWRSASWLALLYGHGAVFIALWVGRLAAGTLPVSVR